MFNSIQVYYLEVYCFNSDSQMDTLMVDKSQLHNVSLSITFQLIMLTKCKSMNNSFQKFHSGSMEIS